MATVELTGAEDVAWDLSDLYQEVILDHNRRPRNFGALADATRLPVFAPDPFERFSIARTITSDTLKTSAAGVTVNYIRTWLPAHEGKMSNRHIANISR